MESEQNIAGGYESSGGWDGSAGATGMDNGMSPGQAAAQFGTQLGPALFAGKTPTQISSPDFRSSQISQLQNIGRGVISNDTYNTGIARQLIGTLQRNFGPLSRSEYNTAMGITATNPYGYEGVFSKLGIDPSKIDYATGAGGIGYGGVERVAAKKYARYTDYMGQDPVSQKRGFGSVFGRPTGEITAEGAVKRTVMDPEDIPLGDALATQGAVLGLGPVLGYGVMELADPFGTYVPSQSKAYDQRLDPEFNPDLPASTIGLAGKRTGLGLEALANKVSDLFAPKTPSPVPTQIKEARDFYTDINADVTYPTETVGEQVADAEYRGSYDKSFITDLEEMMGYRTPEYIPREPEVYERQIKAAPVTPRPLTPQYQTLMEKIKEAAGQ